MNDSLLHQLDRAFLRRKRRTRKPHQIFDTDSARLLPAPSAQLCRRRAGDDDWKSPCRRAARTSATPFPGPPRACRRYRDNPCSSRSAAPPSARAADTCRRRETEFAACHSPWSALRVLRRCAPVRPARSRNHSHGLRPLDQFQRALHHRRINHLRTQADDRQSLACASSKAATTFCAFSTSDCGRRKRLRG